MIRSLIATALLSASVAMSFPATATTPLKSAEHAVLHPASPILAVGPQYDTTHVYVAPEDFDRFTDSLVATFGGHKSQQGVFQVTPTPSQTAGRHAFGIRLQDACSLAVRRRAYGLSRHRHGRCGQIREGPRRRREGRDVP
jgi:hypothetical protein